MSHANATLTPAGRLRLAQLVVDQRWTYARAAERFSVSITTARRWAERYRELGKAGMVDRSSRPLRCPNQLPQRTERRIVKVRVTRRWGPARIAYRLRMAVSTVHQILRRYGCPPLAWTDPATGVRIKWARKKVNSYVHEAPGDLIHVDIKKLGRIPDGGGWRFLGRAEGKRDRRRGVGFVEGSFVGPGEEEADADGFALPDGVASSAEGAQAARITTPARMSAAAAPSRSFIPTG